MFSFSLICESIAAQFLTIVPHGEKTLWRKILLRLGQRKVRFFRRSANFGNVSPFSSKGNQHIFSFYPSTLKIADLFLETTASHSTITWSAWLFRLSPFSRSRHRLCRRTATSTHFSVSPQSRSPFSASPQTFCLTVRANLNKQKYGLFCSLEPLKGHLPFLLGFAVVTYSVVDWVRGWTLSLKQGWRYIWTLSESYPLTCQRHSIHCTLPYWSTNWEHTVSLTTH